MPRVLGMRKITSSQRVDDTAMVHKWLVNEHGSKAAEFGDRATVCCTVQIETGRWIHLQCCCFGDNLSCYLSLCENCDRELFWLPVWIDRCVLDWVFHLPSSPICSAQKHILSLWHGVHNFVLFFLFPCRTNHSIYAFVAWLTMTILYTPLGYPTKSDTNVAVVTANVALSAPCRIFNGHWFEFMIYAMLHWIDMCTKCGKTFCALSLCVQAGGIN